MSDPQATPKTGFLEEAPGVKSSTRLFALILLVDTSALVGATCYYLVKRTPDAAVIAAVATIAGALIAQGVVAIVKRGGGES